MKILKNIITSAALLAGAGHVAIADDVTYFDKFDSVSWSNNDGDLHFSSNWIDSHNADPTSGRMRIVDYGNSPNKAMILDELKKTGNFLFAGNKNDVITRRLNLSGAESAILTFDYDLHLQTPNLLRHSDRVKAELFNVQSGEWEPVWTGTGGNNHADTATIILTPEQISRSSGVRFLSNNDASGWGTADWSKDGLASYHSFVVIENLKFTAVYTADNDNDGVIDVFDIDNDNDGIIDINEGAINFSNLRTSLRINGSASYEDNETVIITNDIGDEFGTAMSAHKVNFDSAFSFEAEVYLGNKNGSGADGIAIVFHNDPRGVNAVGTPGEGLGAVGIKDGFYLEIDTHDNSADGVDDRDYDHLQIRDTNKNASDATGDLSHAPVAAFVYQESSGGNDKNLIIDNDGWHNIRITWDPYVQGGTGSNLIEVFFDGQRRLFIDSFYAKGYLGNESQVFYGFTGSTGGLSNLQRVRHVSFAGKYTDTDHDGVEDYHDLDSDNDGIPDHIEAMTSAGFEEIDFTAGVNAEGVPSDIVSKFGAGGITPANTNESGAPGYPFSDNEPDFIDLDSDGDGIFDCIEGVKSTLPFRDCRIDSGVVGTNGLASWAQTTPGYENPAGQITGVTFPTLSDKFIDYVTTTNEVAYREFANCGNASWKLDADHWVTVATPCEIADPVSDIFAALGSQCVTNLVSESCDWAIYRQKAGDFSGTQSGGYELMSGASDKMEPGKGYWIISATDQEIYPDYNGTLTTQPTPRELATNHGDSQYHYTEVFRTPLITPPGNGEVGKLLLGNPFPIPLFAGDMYSTSDGGQTYNRFGFYSFKPTVFTYDHTDKDTGNYIAHRVDGGPPGFTNTPIYPGYGLWVGILDSVSAADSIGIDFPLISDYYQD